MKSPIPDYLKAVLESVRDQDSGAPAGYIDVLANADTSKVGVAIATVDGTVYSAGDDEVEFSIQSISKAFVYAMAICDAGLDGVLSKIGVEPSGNRFNELSLERESNRPMNPMINAGAITAHSMVVGPKATPEERVDRILASLSKLAGRQLSVDEDVYAAELKDAFRNIGLAYMLKSAGILECEPEDAVRGYIRQCSINVNVRDLAMMGATLANAGVHPVTGEALMSQCAVRQILSVMTTCGMYDGAGDWVSNIGIPAKSGVAGGIMGALPGQLGLATFSPRLDRRGNSVRGVAICKRLSADMGLHMMDISQIGKSTVRKSVLKVATAAVSDDHDHHGPIHQVPMFDLRGAVRFSGAELLTRTVARDLSQPEAHDAGSGCNAGCQAVVFSLRGAISLNSVAQRIVRENVSRLRRDGKKVFVVDPHDVLHVGDMAAEDRPVVVKTVSEATDFIAGTGCRILANDSD
ncbi:related to glutaminase, kidney isoform, mitochondrial precursor [Cephalotrichum gorgonifer]|uniref:glutaminase n=1 Tax=Cephalotrichum gorgonifer TaxID=2041049 RepID=A0AAE8MY25_9PEZI|nr:related to glutaminase, kidney isoform, mitochondrial precursor [Cephalotrichum gorgonifer]